MFLGALDVRPPTDVRELAIPNGYGGTLETLRWMGLLTDDAAHDERVLRLARAITADLPSKAYELEARSLLSWVQPAARNLRYVRDAVVTNGLQRVQDPRWTLFVERSGKCVDLVMVLCALAASIGFPWAFRYVGSDPLSPTYFTHIYALLWIDPYGWVPADPIFDHPLGWEPPLDDPAVQPFATRKGKVTYRRDWYPA